MRVVSLLGVSSFAKKKKKKKNKFIWLFFFFFKKGFFKKIVLFMFIKRIFGEKNVVFEKYNNVKG